MVASILEHGYRALVAIILECSSIYLPDEMARSTKI